MADNLNENRGFWGLLSKKTLKSIHEGLGVELLRDLIKMALMSLGGLGLTIILSGLGDFTWSLRSFNIFGAVNNVETPNQKLGSEAVYRVPFNTSVRLEGGAFLAISTTYDDRIRAVLTSSSGQLERQYISPSTPLFATIECEKIGVQMMEIPAKNATDVLILYTVEHEKSDRCRGFWGNLFD